MQDLQNEIEFDIKPSSTPTDVPSQSNSDSVHVPPVVTQSPAPPPSPAPNIGESPVTSYEAPSLSSNSNAAPEGEDLVFPTPDLGSDAQSVTPAPEPANDPSPSDSAPTQSFRRSSRVRKGVDRLTSSKLGDLVSESMLNALGVISSYFSTLSDKPSHCYISFKLAFHNKLATHHAKLMQYDMAVQLNVDGTLNFIHPLSFAAETKGNDVFYFHQAMQEDD